MVGGNIHDTVTPQIVPLGSSNCLVTSVKFVLVFLVVRLQSTQSKIHINKSNFTVFKTDTYLRPACVLIDCSRAFFLLVHLSVSGPLS